MVTNMKSRLVRAAIGIAAVGTALFTAALPAQAQTTWTGITGQTNTGGSVVYYGIYRAHTVSGPVTLYMNKGVTNGAQYAMYTYTGNSLPWSGTLNAGGQKGWTGVLAGNYAIKAQQNSCSFTQKLFLSCGNSWTGTLTM